jgi:hypothetical protein
MVGAGLLAKTNRAKSAICTGCEAQCHKPVILRRKPGANIPSAFIVCDEEPDHGRVPVRLSRLDQFNGSLATAACFAASALKLGIRELQCLSGQFVLGWRRGRNGPREVALCVKSARILLSVGEQEQDVTDFVYWANGDLSVDHDLLQRLANRKGRQTKGGYAKRDLEKSAKTNRKELLAHRDKEILRQAHRLKTASKTLTEVSAEIAAMPFIRSSRDVLRPVTAATVRRIVTEGRRR